MLAGLTILDIVKRGGHTVATIELEPKFIWETEAEAGIEAMILECAKWSIKLDIGSRCERMTYQSNFFI